MGQWRENHEWRNFKSLIAGRWDNGARTMNGETLKVHFVNKNRKTSSIKGEFKKIHFERPWNEKRFTNLTFRVVLDEDEAFMCEMDMRESSLRTVIVGLLVIWPRGYVLLL
ncbi:hypothetical protein QE152_g7226 [Popillia japonica]|uniref:Uncharacterized protein n=1 Tax=Popillia japonica TaxID=7064 RepID=A0AAW1MG90_POPJA